MPLGFELPFMAALKAKPKEKKMPAGKPGAFDEEKVEYIAPSMRFFIAEKWKQYSDEEKKQIISQRARRGVRCHVCGKMGFYRENCPNNCVSPPPTPDSMASTPPGTPPPSPPGLGVLWGSLGFDAAGDKEEAAEKKRSYVPLKADLTHAKKESTERKEQLRETDFAVGGFEFFARADAGYNRTLPELTLHQVLRRLMRLVERQLIANAEKLEAKVDVTLLHPPNNPDRENFFSEALGRIKEHKQYFLAKQTKNERSDRLAHKFQGSNLPDDQLDDMFRGGQDNALKFYQRNPKAGATMHSKIGWKSVLARHDQLAVSDPNALAKSIEVEAHFKAQGAWTSKQKKDMEQTNDRYEHLVYIIRNEMKKEHEREELELEGAVKGKKVGRKAQMDVWLARLDSIDKLMMVLKEYHIVGALDEADLLVYQVDRWSAHLKKSIPEPENKRVPKPAAAPDPDDPDAQETGKNDVWGTVLKAVQIERGTTRAGTAPKAEKKKKKKTAGNAMLAAGASPYYESDIFAEKFKKQQARLALHWKRPPSRPLSSLAGLAAADEDSWDGGNPAGEDNDDMSVGSLDSQDRPYKTQGAGVLGDSLAQGSLASSQQSQPTRSSSQGSVSILRSGRVRIVPSSKPDSFPANYTVDIDAEQFDIAREKQAARVEMKRELRKKYKHADMRMPDFAVISAQNEAFSDVEARKAFNKQKKLGGWRPPKFSRVPRVPAHEADEAAMEEVRQKFINAGLADNIRKGRQSDLAYMVPSLIPVPGAFEGDDTERLSSYTGAKIVDGLQGRMVSDLGHTERKLLPLYVRNTLIEVNGTSANGDQTQEVLSKDRRYSHYHGRPLLRFEEGSQLVDSRAFLKEQGSGFGPNKKQVADKLAPLRAEREAKKTAKRIAEQRYQPMNRSMVRLVFGQDPKPAKDLAYVEHKL